MRKNEKGLVPVERIIGEKFSSVPALTCRNFLYQT
jgi:hypothetical protein